MGLSSWIDRTPAAPKKKTPVRGGSSAAKAVSKTAAAAPVAARHVNWTAPAVSNPVASAVGSGARAGAVAVRREAARKRAAAVRRDRVVSRKALAQVLAVGLREQKAQAVRARPATGGGVGVRAVPNYRKPGGLSQEQQAQDAYWFDSGGNMHRSDLGIYPPGASQNPTGRVGTQARPHHPDDVYGLGAQRQNEIPSRFFGQDGNASVQPYSTPSGEIPNIEDLSPEMRRRLGLTDGMADWGRNL